MFRDFLVNNNRSILIISILLIGWLLLYLFKGDETEVLLKDPQNGQIYIFQEDDLYAPMRLDSVADNQLYFRNYLYFFSTAIPKRNQILPIEFDLNFFAIYERDEIQRLYDEDRIVRIYAN